MVVYITLGPLSFVVVLPIYLLAAVYPLAKRFLPWPQLVLAPTFALTVLLGWISVRGLVYLTASVPLSAFFAVWAVYFDTVYALQVRT